ncbi:MAG: transposase [Polyangiaceae bacterium]|nr:transposase [Polyangiaceae bacterium]
MENELSKIRELVLTSRAAGAKRYPRGVRERVLAYARGRLASGLSWRAVADEIGLNLHTLRFWRERATGKDSKQPKKLKAVVVQSTPAAEPKLSLHGPRGTRVDGLSVESAAALLRALE